MRKIVIALLFLNGWCIGSRAQSLYWQQELQYTIDVSLNDVEHTLTGFMKLQYINHSPDTLHFIWFQLWPNAFKNDRTAFSEQLLQEGRTDFYFSGREQRGYMNRLDFRVDNNTLETEDHPQYIDVVKVYLPAPLAPGAQTSITTPFHVKLPANFSRMGHTGQSYQVAYWYPRPAVYDGKGWHPGPYLSQGEGYAEFGTYDVRITLPQNYVVAASGELQNEEEKNWLKNRTSAPEPEKVAPKKNFWTAGKPPAKKTAVKKTATEKQAPSKKSTLAKAKSNTKKKPAFASKKTSSQKSSLKNKRSSKLPAQEPVEEPATSVADNAAGNVAKEPAPVPTKGGTDPGAVLENAPAGAMGPTKTLRYKLANAHDFAWFAGKRYLVQYDTVQLPGGRTIEAWSMYTPENRDVWKNSMKMIKDAVHFRSRLIGDYPYHSVSVVEAKIGFDGGMEYPAITSISPMKDEKSLDLIIEHEIGHNWFMGALASNERDHPWMDEGINTYYDRRYEAWKYPNKPSNRFLPDDLMKWGVDILTKVKKDQPISTPSEEFSFINYNIIGYAKAAMWMEQLDSTIGRERFDSSMKRYYREWQFKHPMPEDFKRVMEQGSGRNLDQSFAALDQKGSLTSEKRPKKLKLAIPFSAKEYDRYEYINLLPALGYNMYDKFMAGLLIHNYTPPAKNFEYALAPLYAFGSKQFNGIGKISYSWYPNKQLQKIELGLTGARFSTDERADSNGVKIYRGFHKLVPSLRVTFNNRSARSTVEKWLEWKTYFIGEGQFKFDRKSTDGQYYPSEAGEENRYLNQLTFSITDYRALYPYDVQVQVQQGDGFYRATATGNYLLNYAKGGGMRVRVFAAKFGTLGDGNSFNTALYQPKLTAVRGIDDYTYSNYFIGRSELDGFAGQQIMMRDGGLKIRADLFQDPPVRSDNWLAAVNLNTTLPEKLFPIKLPLRLFLDVGTYSQSWKRNATVSRFLYVGGLQVSLFKELLNVYAPLVYSSEFRNNLKTVPEENKFFKKISFSIDIQRFNLRKIANNQFPF